MADLMIGRRLQLVLLLVSGLPIFLVFLSVNAGSSIPNRAVRLRHVC